MVYANADSRMMFFANVEKGNKSFLNLLQFLCVFLVGVIVLDKASCRIDIVSRVNTYLLSVTSSDICHVRVEVNVGYKWCGKAVITNVFANML